MPTKKTVASGAQDDAEAKSKPKRKITSRKKKSAEEPDLSALPGAVPAGDIDGVAKSVSADDLHHHHVTPTPESQEMMRDIKPREFHRDAAFLVPEKFGFDLKPEQPTHRKQSNLIKRVSIILSVLIIILFAVLVGLTVYSNHAVKNDTGNVAVPDNSQQQQTSSGAYNIGLANIPAALHDPLKNVLTANLKDGYAISDSTATLPQETSDTLFVKQAGMSQTNALMDLLAKNGLKPNILQQNDLPQDAVIYLVPTAANVDLTGLTAAVYNATGVSGLAKTNCDTLTKKYHVSSCSALNATSRQPVTTIDFKDYKTVFTLGRTPEFSSAQYHEAASNQVEDIRVTLGK